MAIKKINTTTTNDITNGTLYTVNPVELIEEYKQGFTTTLDDLVKKEHEALARFLNRIGVWAVLDLKEITDPVRGTTYQGKVIKPNTVMLQLSKSSNNNQYALQFQDMVKNGYEVIDSPLLNKFMLGKGIHFKIPEELQMSQENKDSLCNELALAKFEAAKKEYFDKTKVSQWIKAKIEENTKLNDGILAKQIEDEIATSIKNVVGI